MVAAKAHGGKTIGRASANPFVVERELPNLQSARVVIRYSIATLQARVVHFYD